MDLSKEIIVSVCIYQDRIDSWSHVTGFKESK